MRVNVLGKYKNTNWNLFHISPGHKNSVCLTCFLYRDGIEYVSTFSLVEFVVNEKNILSKYIDVENLRTKHNTSITDIKVRLCVYTLGMVGYRIALYQECDPHQGCYISIWLELSKLSPIPALWQYRVWVLPWCILYCLYDDVWYPVNLATGPSRGLPGYCAYAPKRRSVNRFFYYDNKK